MIYVIILFSNKMITANTLKEIYMKKTFKKLLFGICAAALIFTQGCVKITVTTSDQAADSSSYSSTSDSDSSSNNTAASSYYPSIEHTDISLSDRSRDSFDKDQFDNYCNEFKTSLESSGNEGTLFNNYELIKKELNKLSSDDYLALYDYYLDVNNEDASTASAKKDDLYRNSFSDACSLFKEALSSDYADAFTNYIGTELAEGLADFSELTDEENQMFNKQTELVQRYDSLISDEANPDAIKQLYIEIIENNNEIANYYGYDNYFEYAYSNVFMRDFTIDDINSISNEIIYNVVPLFAAYTDVILDKGNISNIYDENTDSGKKKFTTLRSCVESVSPELTSSLDHLLKNNLYDVDYNESKQSLGFTASLPSYNDGYIYDLPDNTVADYATIVHEFGHYNHIYNTEADTFNSASMMDVQEIMSQGLQVLFYDYYDQLVGKDYGTALSDYTIYQLLSNTIQAFAINEAEYNCYTESNLTTQKLDDIWNDAFDKYYLSLENTFESWTYISHVFESPFYYISYGTSALASFEIFTESRNNFDVGVDKYLTISALPDDVTFTKALDKAGLKNIFTDGTISSLSSTLVEFFDINDTFTEYQNYIDNSIAQNDSGDTFGVA